MSERPIRTVQLRSAAVPADLTMKALCRRRKSIFFFLLFPLCACLGALASRWWAWTLIKGLSPEEALQVRAKVASLEALKGQRADLGLQRAWEGNYLVSVRDGSVGGGWSSVICVFICLKGEN